MSSALPTVSRLCVPARRAAPTGRSGRLTVGCLRSDWDMPPEMTAIPKKLKEGGYATHMVYVYSHPAPERRSRAEHV